MPVLPEDTTDIKLKIFGFYMFAIAVEKLKDQLY